MQQLIDVVLGVLMHKNTKYIAYVVEGLLEHCFSEYRKEYHPEDIRWFLELVNQQLWDEIYPTDSTIKSQICDLLKCEIFTEHFPSGCISLNVFKFYLSRILSKSKAVSSRLSVVVPWNNEVSCNYFLSCLANADLFVFPPDSFRNWASLSCSQTIL